MEISDLTLEERETHLNMVANDRSVWEVYTDDPVMMRRFEKAKAEFVREAYGGGRFYRLQSNQVTIRKPPRISKEQREAMAERARQTLHAEDTGAQRPVPVAAD